MVANPAGPARIGLIIPSVNRQTEVDFPRFAADSARIHVTRVRIGPVTEVLPKVVEAAEMLGDAGCDIIVFHCTRSAMEEGPEAERLAVDAMRDATGRTCISTAGGVTAAFDALGTRKVALITPYKAAVNDRQTEFLNNAGIDVVHSVALSFEGPNQYTAATPEFWVETTVREAHPDADTYFLSCTLVRCTEVVEEIEAKVGKPVVTSNQATLWTSLRACGIADPIPGFGHLGQITQPVLVS